ncbi:19515_t:CDS:1, partial [Gigaspora rosea]
KRGPKTNSSSLSNINPSETAIKALFSSNNSSAFETPNPYNYKIILPNIHETTEAFQNMSIDQPTTGGEEEK